ncbi:MAG: hypothetical protein EP347_00805 [Alphaproteobacteria bacterium]|nr:MAG: hypothetical protein EP347_00805 [Alphaproteobacteria bacterium]
MPNSRQTSTLALIIGIWALSGRPISLAYAEDVARETDRSQVEASKDKTQIDRSAATETAVSDQENVKIVPPGDGDIELVIKMLSDLLPTEFMATTSTLDVDASLNRIADDINAAYQANKLGEVLDMAQANPDVRDVRPDVRVLEAWSLHRLGRSASALEAFSALYANEPLPSHASGVLYAGINSERFSKVYNLAEADDGPLGQILVHGKDANLPVETQAEIKKVRVDFLTSWLAAAFKYDLDYTARRVTDLLALEGVKPNVGPQILAMGWRAYNRENFAEADRLFKTSKSAGGLSTAQRDEATYGRALSLRASGDNDGALALAEAGAPSHAGMAELVAVIREDQQPALQVGDAATATDYMTAEETPWVMSAAERATYRGHFLLAAKADPETFGPMKETGITWLGDTLRVQSRDGDKGLSKLTIVSDKIGAAWSSGLSHYKVELEWMSLDAGGQHDGTRPVGLWDAIGGPIIPEFIDEETSLLVPHISWWREGATSWHAELGASPIGGEADPTVTGRLGLDIFDGPAKTSLSLYRTPVYESILSASGAKDPISGEAFGGVVETGLEVSYFGPLSEQWNVSAGGSWGQRTGEHVQDNNHVKVALGISLNLEKPGFTYLSIGPSYRYESYDHNLSQFTVGHGGYYSPQELHNLGLALNFMTDEGREWLVKGDVSIGAQTATQDESPYYPILPGPHVNFYSGDDTTGLGIQGQMQGVWRLSDRWMLEAGAYGQNNEDFSEVMGFIKLRFHFGARSATYSSDLTEPLYRQW